MAPPLPASVRRSAGATPDPAVTALAAALDSLILRDDKADPLGAGDWRAARAAIGAFYADRGFQPIWIDADGLTPAGRSVFARLARASDDGLDLGAYAAPGLVGGPLSVDERAWTEAAISAAVVVYAQQASGSRVSPSHISPLIGVRPDIPDPGAALAEIAAAPDPGARLAEFNPPQKGYRDLREALNRLSGSGVPPARVGDDLGTTPSLLASNADRETLVKIAAPRMRRLNRRFVASAGALPAASARERATILANMEMWRWQPRDMGERRIEVNVPDFTVAVMDGDEVVHRARVVVGKPKTPTPIFSNVIRYVVINPSWRVPDSIIRKEMMSKLDYLASHGYEVKTVNGHLTVRQLPGAAQRARPPRLHVPERLCGLSARHAVARTLQRRRPRFQPRLREGPGSGAPRGNCAGLERRAESPPPTAIASARSSCRSRCPSTSNISPPRSTNTAIFAKDRTSMA